MTNDNQFLLWSLNKKRTLKEKQNKYLRKQKCFL